MAEKLTMLDELADIISAWTKPQILPYTGVFTKDLKVSDTEYVPETEIESTIVSKDGKSLGVVRNFRRRDD